jgi:hypothetical protein
MAITVKHSKVSTIPDGDDSSVVRPSDWNDDHVLTGTIPVANGGTGASTLTGYVKGNGTTTMTASSTIPNTDITGLGTASTKDAGVANGVATLDGSGTVPISQLPAAVLGALSYQGTWNASTNTPTLTSSVGTKGYYYVVSVAGSTNLNGITDWVVGDWAVFNGSVWQKVDNTDAVTSVNGYTGTVNLTYTDVGAFPATSTTGSGNVVLATGATQANPTISNYENFTPTTAPSYSEGRVWYDSTEKALAFYNDSSALAVHVSQDLIFKVINNTGSTISNGSPVYITGTSSGQTYPNVALARADVAATSAVIGLTNGAIANGAIGYVTSQGTIDNVNTSTFTVGQVLYLSPYSAGQLMNTIPPTGITVQVGVATYIDSSAGHIYVKQTTPLAVPASIITGTLGVDHGGTGATTLTGYVKGSGTSAMTASSTIPTTDLSGTVTNAQLANSTITINGNSTALGGSVSVGTVTSVAATAGTGISVSGSPITGSGTLTVTNTAPDQTVVLTAGTGISTSGTYPNFTITNTSPSSGGTVTSVTATSPVTSTGGNTPVISMPAATASVNGYLTSADWTTFNNKGSGTVTSVGLSAPSIFTVGGSPVTGSGTLALTYSGTALPIANGGTGATTAPAANANLLGWTTTATAAGTTTLTNTSSFQQEFTGATTQTVVLPVTSTLALGWSFEIINNSTGNLTINSSGGNLVGTITSGTTASLVCVLNSGTTAASWDFDIDGFASQTGTGSVVRAASPTITGTLTASGDITTPVITVSNGIVCNANTIAANYTIPATSNAMSAGPITVNTGVTVTVSTGSTWVVV